MGGGAGGAIGAVFLLGGALATAALASAFVVGRNGRSSGGKTRDESDKAQECKNPSTGDIKEVESDGDTAFLVSNQESTLDVDPIVEKMLDEMPDNLGDKLETDSISDGHVVIEEKVSLLDEESQFEPRNDDGVTIELNNENQNLDEQVVVEEEKTESEPTDEYEAVEITEKQPKSKEDHDELRYDEEEIKVILVDNNNEVEVESELEEIHVIDNGEMIFSESDSEDGHKAIQPVLESRVIEHENVIVEIGKENEFVEESEGEEECDQPDELIVVEKHEDTTCLVKEELIISSENVEVTTKDGENYLEGDKNETSLDFAVAGQEKQDEDENVETIYKENNDSVTKKNEDDQTVLSDEVRLVDRELGGKIQEDHKAVKNVELDSDEKSENRTMSSGKTFNVKKYVIMNERLTNSTNRRLIIAIISVMSSLSCSWFFGLSSVQLCLVVFLTMAMSSMVTE
ncbi:hypothetical protein CASFOL_009037 [Castilleja foliolosa]|uniref:Uncharacterized protein n=1 Tax=Castilleja foliolosa TaxID=1961234 RepID=A0ABD3E4R8_9LAMI